MRRRRFLLVVGMVGALLTIGGTANAATPMTCPAPNDSVTILDMGSIPAGTSLSLPYPDLSTADPNIMYVGFQYSAIPEGENFCSWHGATEGVYNYNYSGTTYCGLVGSPDASPDCTTTTIRDEHLYFWGFQYDTSSAMHLLTTAQTNSAIGGGGSSGGTTGGTSSNDLQNVSFTEDLKGFFLGSVVSKVLGLMLIVFSITTLMLWGKRSVKAR